MKVEHNPKYTIFLQHLLIFSLSECLVFFWHTKATLPNVSQKYLWSRMGPEDEHCTDQNYMKHDFKPQAISSGS